MVSKTRDKLIEVARQLFIKKGVENTTMNDIATASDRGRRTIYTYFKNKREIYKAVIESQSEQSVHQLRLVVESDMSPEQKLEEYFNRRFQMIEHLGPKADRMKYFFNREQRRVERVMKLTNDKEKEILHQILQEGITKRCFKLGQAQALMKIEHVLTASAYLEANEAQRDTLVKFIVESITIDNNG